MTAHPKRKQFSWSHAKLSKLTVATDHAFIPKDNLRPHQTAYITNELSKFHTPKSLVRNRRVRPSADQEESLSLAYSNVPLPREKTFPGKQGLTCISKDFDVANLSIQALFEMGILWCDQEEDMDFGLNDIVHDEPVYRVSVRVDKKKRRVVHRVLRGGDGEESVDGDGLASPTLSYCDVADDEALGSWAMEDDYVDLGNVWSM